jgi:hypothetical protein
MGCRNRIAFIALLTATGISPAQDARTVPEALRPPAGQSLAFELKALGVQIYECRPRKEDPARCEWVFKAPEAELFESSGRPAGRHYGGPTWEGLDGSKVVGEVKAKDTSRSSGSIPWLLLSAKATSGEGRFSRILSILRLNTTGGAAPAMATSAQIGQEARVPYTATYAFFVASP